MTTYAEIAAGHASSPSPLTDRVPTVSDSVESTIQATGAAETVSEASDAAIEPVVTISEAAGATSEPGYTSQPPAAMLRFYLNLDELRDALQTWAATKGFAVSLIRTRPGKGSRASSAVIGCRLSGDYRPNSLHRRHPDAQRDAVAASMKCNCPFKVRAVETDGAWLFEVVNGEHNHPPLPPTAFHEHRQVSAAANDTLQTMVEQNAPRVVIENTLRTEHPDIGEWLTRRRLYALIDNLRERRGCNSDAETMLERMRQQHAENPDDLVRLMLEPNGRVAGLFYSTRRARCLTRRYLSSFALDCTYKTNLYDLPLLQIVGTAGTGQSFTSAIVMMVSESRAWYQHALEVWRDFMGLYGRGEPRTLITDREGKLRDALEDVFPNASKLVCLWHIQKNMREAKGVLNIEQAREYIQKWTSVVSQSTEEKFLEAKAALDAEYDDLEPRVRVRYDMIRAVGERAIEDDGGQFILCYTKNARAFGLRASSRAESTHARLKSHLGHCKRDLVDLTGAARSMMASEWTTIIETLAVNMRDNGKRFPSQLEGLARRITTQAMLQLADQHRLKEAYRTETARVINCSGGFRASYGLPCWHELLQAEEAQVPITINDADLHWRVETAADIEAYGIIEYSAVGIAARAVGDAVEPPELPTATPHGAIVDLEDGEQAIHLSSVYRPSQPTRVVSRGGPLDPERVQIVPAALDRLPAEGTQSSQRTRDRSTQRLPTREEWQGAEELGFVKTGLGAGAESETDVEELDYGQGQPQPTPVRSTEQRRLPPPWCATCEKRVRHRKSCPKGKRKARAATAAEKPWCIGCRRRIQHKKPCRKLAKQRAGMRANRRASASASAPFSRPQSVSSSSSSSASSSSSRAPTQSFVGSFFSGFGLSAR